MANKVAMTVQTVEAAKAKPAAYRMHDSKVPGLFLRVLPSGVKSWNVTWARNRDLSIGKYPVITLEAARRKARAKLAEADEHGAPLTKARGKDLTLADFDAFKAARLKAKRAPATVNRDLDRIKAALALAVAWGMLAVSPLAGSKRIKRDIEERVRHLSPKEEKALRKALEARESAAKAGRDSANVWRKERGIEPLPAITGYSDHLMPMTLLALNTGLRRGELTQLKWSDIDLDGKRLTVRAGYAKSGKARHLPLNSEALAVLKLYRKQYTGKGELFGVQSVKTAWGNLMAAAKIQEFRFHDTRHTFASKLVMAGVDLNTVRELLGHGDIAMTLRYAHLAPEHKAAAVEKLV